MPIQFRCTKCSKLLAVKDEAAGKRIKCPGCATVLSVPATGSEPRPQAGPEDVPPPHPPATPPSTASPEPTTAAVAQTTPFIPVQQAAVAQLPMALTIALAAIVVFVLLGLLALDSLKITLPLIIMAGFWGVLIARRCHACLPMVVSVSPLLAVAVFMILGFMFRPSNGEGFLRFILVLYGMVFIPTAAYARAQVIRASGQPDPVIAKKKAGIGILAACVVVVGAGWWLFGGSDSGDTHATKAEKKLHAQLDKADEFWEADKKPQAIKEYKAYLRAEGSKDYVRVYRRVIDYEAQYGDPGEMRDWIKKAWDGITWTQRPDVTFESKKAQELWDNLLGQRENRRNVTPGGWQN